MFRILAWVFLLSGCTPAAREQAEKDAKSALDKACNARAVEKLAEADAGR